MKIVDNMLEFFAGFKEMKMENDQRICRMLVDKEVYGNVNSMVEFILMQDSREAPFTWDDITNFYAYPEHQDGKFYFEGGTESEKEEYLEDLLDQMEAIDSEIQELDEQIDQINEDIDDIRGEFLANKRIDRIRDSINQIKDMIEELETKRQELSDFYDEVDALESEPQEVFEWWMVSRWLARKLEVMGHPVIVDDEIWGKCTLGQAIYIDSTIRQIAEDAEILTCQQYQWT